MKKKHKLNKQQIIEKYDASAGHIRRLIAYGIDWYITSLLVMAPVAFLYSIEMNEKALVIDISLLSIKSACLAFVIGLILCIWYLVYLPLKNGQTLGKKITSIKIVKMNGSTVDFLTLVKREVIGVLVIEGVMFTCSTYFHQLLVMIFNLTYSNYIAYFFTIILIVSILLAVIKPEKRMVHDYIANTKVISISNS